MLIIVLSDYSKEKGHLHVCFRILFIVVIGHFDSGSYCNLSYNIPYLPYMRTRSQSLLDNRALLALAELQTFRKLNSSSSIFLIGI